MVHPSVQQTDWFLDGIRGKARRTLMTKRWTLKVFTIFRFFFFSFSKINKKTSGHMLKKKNLLFTEHTKLNNVTTYIVFLGIDRLCSNVIFLVHFLMHGSLLRTISRNIDKYSAPVCNNHTFATKSIPKNMKRKHSKKKNQKKKLFWPPCGLNFCYHCFFLSIDYVDFFLFSVLVTPLFSFVNFFAKN